MDVQEQYRHYTYRHRTCAMKRVLLFALLVLLPQAAFATTCGFGTDIGGGQCRGYLTSVAVPGTVTTFATAGTGLVNFVFDSSGNLYIPDSWTNTIRKITPSGAVSAFAS